MVEHFRLATFVQLSIAGSFAPGMSCGTSRPEQRSSLECSGCVIDGERLPEKPRLTGTYCTGQAISSTRWGRGWEVDVYPGIWKSSILVLAPSPSRVYLVIMLSSFRHWNGIVFV